MDTGQCNKHREKRLYESVEHEDQRSLFEKDRDRILYSSAFRRLAGVTQVASAEEGHIFHNRLTHSIKVAQIGLRIAQWLNQEHREYVREYCIDPVVVEAACLAHDLGHPVFGHVGEAELNRLVINENNEYGDYAGDPDGFEGNAQTFRVLTKLAARFEEVDGLNLTAATLSAVIKYPWYRDPSIQKQSKKWGAYRVDQVAFSFARKHLDSDLRTDEATIMDWADDIAYSVHDVEDFHRANLIPWALIRSDTTEQKELVQDTVNRWWNPPKDAASRAKDALERILKLAKTASVLERPYTGARDQRARLRWWTSELIGRYVTAIAPSGDKQRLEINRYKQDEVRVLKQIVWKYVILNPALSAQQYGQRRIIKELFYDLFDIYTSSTSHSAFPFRCHHLVGEATAPARIIADCISSLTESEAIALHKRLRGVTAGTLINPIVR